MFGPLTIQDYPLIVIGNAIYRRTESSALAIFPSSELAGDICTRLNLTLISTKENTSLSVLHAMT